MFLFIALLFFISCGSALDLSRETQVPPALNDIHISSTHILKIIPIDVRQGDATLIIGDNNEGIRAGDLVKSIQSHFKKSQGTVYTILREYVSKKLLIKEDRTKGGTERVVYYKRPYQQ